MILEVKVVPNSQVTKLREVCDGVLVIELNAQPEKNNANNELIKFLAKSLKIKKDQIEIISGHKSKNKRVKVDVECKITKEGFSCN